MGDLTTNFSRYEFECNCGCGFNSIDFETLIVLEDVRDHFDKAVRVTSAARCFDYNRKPVDDGGPGSNNRSQHPLARAVDFSVKDIPASEVQAYLKARYPMLYGIGSYSGFTHIDTRTNGPERW